MNMQLIQDKDFNEYIESYKKLKLKDKQELIETELKKIIVLLNTKNKELGLEESMLYNREILDTKKESVNNDDFAESVFVYINSIEELLADYINKVERRI